MGVSFSLSYDLINPGDWKPVTDPDTIYNKSGWTTYSIKMDKMAKLKINEIGIFSFAWKMDQFDSNGKLYFKHSRKQEVLDNILDWNEMNYNVNLGDEVSWYLTNSVQDLLIAFPSEKIQPSGKFSTNSPPSVPNILSGPSEGYNKSLYDFSVKSSDPDGDRIAYIFNWGDGNISKSEFFGSGTVVIQNHSWDQAGFYSVTVAATDKQGDNSGFSEACAIKISWLVKVPQGLPLQPVIDNISSNTTILLEGNKYDGTINIEKVNWINISSNLTQTYIYSDNINYNWTIGLENANDITINRINVAGGLNGIYLHNCSHCKILNNMIYSVIRGIHVFGGHDNIIADNNITMIDNDFRPSVGLSLEDTWNNFVNCNIILNEKNSGVLYYIRNSTFKENKISLINSKVHNRIIQHDPSKYGILDGDECCCNLTQSNVLNCRKCIYRREGAGLPIEDEDCNLPFRVVICA